MKYKDDLFNVYGLLRKKTGTLVDGLLETAKQQEANEARLQELTAESDELYERTRRISEQLGLEMPSKPQKLVADEPITALVIRLEPDYDFEKAFRALVKEAKEAGFTDTHPEELLTGEEMQRAAERSRQLDQQFAAQTGLRKKDIGVLMIVSAIKIAMHYIELLWICSKNAADSAKFQENLLKETEPHLEAMQGVDMSLVKEIDSLSDLTYSGGKLLSIVRGGKSKNTRILDKQTILTEHVPFDIPDNDLFTRAELLGYDPIMGWLFGTLNFLTNTVTTKKFHSYSVIGIDNGRIGVGDKLSTFTHVLFPIVKDAKQNKDSVVAAMVREADVQKVLRAPYEKVSKLMNMVFREREQTQKAFSFGQAFASSKKIDVKKIIKNSSMNAFLDLLVAAVCSVMYNPETDGDERYYSVRIHKILLLSNAFATIANTVPVFFTKNVKDTDFSGIVNTLMSLFHSVRFWTEIKTEFLFSEYKKVMDELLLDIDQHFVTADSSI